jgi:hypothetical protein
MMTMLFVPRRRSSPFAIVFPLFAAKALFRATGHSI